MLTSIWWKTSC